MDRAETSALHIKGDTAELCSASDSRAAVYRVLASLYFKELTEEQIESISELDLSSMEDLDELFADGLHDIERSVRRRNSGTREELAVDYAHSILAAGTYDERRATPFESVFTSDTGLLMQDARDDVYRLFCQEHLEARPELRVPEDHLSFIFEFMAILGERFSSELAEGNVKEAKRLLDVQSTLHERHLANWIDDYCDVLEAVCRTRFYRGVSKMTRGFVRLDGEVLAEMRGLLSE